MDMFWRTKSGIYMPLSKMDTVHVKNCIRMLNDISKYSFDDFGKMLDYWWAVAHESDNIPDAPSINTIRPSGYTKVWLDVFQKELNVRRKDFELDYFD